MLAGRSAGLGASIAVSSGRKREVDVGEIRNLFALLDDLRLGRAHIDRLTPQSLGDDKPKTVDVGLRRHLAAGEAELLR